MTIEAVHDYAYRIYTQDKSGHGMDHINRVVALCRHIIADMPADADIDSDIILTAAYVHDTIDPKVVSDVPKARQDLIEFLESQNYPAEQQAEIFHIIDHMSFSKNLAQRQELTLNGQIVQDADRLDAIGTIGIARAFYYGGSFGDDLYDPTIAPRDLTIEKNYRTHSTVINHFYEKLFTLKEALNTPAAKRIGELRDERMRSFVVDFISEWNGRP